MSVEIDQFLEPQALQRINRDLMPLVKSVASEVLGIKTLYLPDIVFAEKAPKIIEPELVKPELSGVTPFELIGQELGFVFDTERIAIHPSQIKKLAVEVVRQKLSESNQVVDVEKVVKYSAIHIAAATLVGQFGEKAAEKDWVSEIFSRTREIYESSVK